VDRQRDRPAHKGYCAVHRDIRSAGDVTQFDPVLDERLLERERAAEGKAHEIVAPDMKEVERLLDQLAPAPHAITRQIGADVEIFTQTGQVRVAGPGNREHRTGLRVGLGEAQKVVGQRLRQNDQIGLHVAGRQTRRRTGEIPRSNAKTLAHTSCDTSTYRFIHQSIPIFCAIILPHILRQECPSWSCMR